MTLASEIKPGDRITLLDGKTIVTVTGNVRNTEKVFGPSIDKVTPGSVRIYWGDGTGNARFMVYSDDDEITVQE